MPSIVIITFLLYFCHFLVRIIGIRLTPRVHEVFFGCIPIVAHLGIQQTILVVISILIVVHPLTRIPTGTESQDHLIRSVVRIFITFYIFQRFSHIIPLLINFLQLISNFVKFPFITKVIFPCVGFPILISLARLITCCIVSKHISAGRSPRFRNTVPVKICLG